MTKPKAAAEAVADEFHERLRAAAITPYEVAKRLGLPSQCVYEILAGRRWARVVARARDYEERWRKACEA